MKTYLPVVAVTLMWAAMLTTAQAEVYVSPFGGYSFGTSEFDVNDSQLGESDSLDVAESGHYGVMLGVGTGDPGNMYFLYSHQATDLKTRFNQSTNLVTPVAIDYFHLGGSLFFPSGQFKPYITASAGATQFRPDGGFSNETRFSMAIGGGVDIALTPSVSIFSDLRGYATFLSNDSSLFCDSNQCLLYIHGDVMWQVQANVGLSVKF